MAGIWVFAENREQTLELLNAGKALAVDFATKLTAFARDMESARDYIGHGADEILLLAPQADDQTLESFVPVIADAARADDPDVLLICATRRGNEMAARIAARLNTGLCSGCNAFRTDNGNKFLTMERLLFAGLAIQTLIPKARPQMATIAPRTFDPAVPQGDKEGVIRELPAPPASVLKVVSRTPKERESVDITEAKIVVCVGRGVEKKEDVELARELARALGGEVGCSRPVAEELRWLPEDVYLGISGKKIKPDLYVGLGVSGQIQHVTGIRDSKVIFAINKDENAPIFEAADYGIVGDLYQVVPMLIQTIKSVLKA
jgi:electron transfer flavoprotein alpha subunit